MSENYIKIPVNRTLSARPIIFNDHKIIAKEIWVPKHFLEALPSPNPNHKYLQAEEISDIICDVIERDGNFSP